MLSLVPLLDVWGVLLAFAIGAAIGYFGYNIRQVVQVSAKVARETIPTTVHIVPKVWKYMIQCPQISIPSAMSLAVWIFLMIAIGYSSEPPPSFGAWALIGSMTFFWCVGLLWFHYGFLSLACQREITRKQWLARWGTDSLSVLRDEGWWGFRMTITEYIRLHLDATLAVVLYVGDFLYWTGKFLFWTVPCWIYRAVRWFVPAVCWRLPLTIGRMVKRIFLEIHSDLRLLCSVDGPVGGFFTYTLLWKLEMLEIIRQLSSLEQLGFVLLGGLIAMGLGVFSYKIISIRILQLEPARVNN